MFGHCLFTGTLYELLIVTLLCSVRVIARRRCFHWLERSGCGYVEHSLGFLPSFLRTVDLQSLSAYTPFIRAGSSQATTGSSSESAGTSSILVSPLLPPFFCLSVLCSRRSLARLGSCLRCLGHCGDRRGYPWAMLALYDAVSASYASSVQPVSEPCFLLVLIYGMQSVALITVATSVFAFSHWSAFTCHVSQATSVVVSLRRGLHLELASFSTFLGIDAQHL